MPSKKNSRKIKSNKSKNNDSTNLVSYSSFSLPPVVPGSKINDLCNKIDAFYNNYSKQHQKQKASDLIKGAFYAMRTECRSNTDWMSQSANSARDVLYPLFSEGISTTNLIGLFKKYALDKNGKSKKKNKDFIDTFRLLDKIYRQLSDITHHGTNLTGFSDAEFKNFSEIDFKNLMEDFTFVLDKSFDYQQIYIHNIIDIIAQKKNKPKGIKKDLDLIIKINSDAHQYFYSRIDENWLNYLWEHGFLDVIKTKPKDLTTYSFRTPEINYISKAAKKFPVEVTKIVLNKDIATTKDKFRPELIDQIIRICEGLSERELALIIPKICEQKWINLMYRFNRWGFEYEKIFETLLKAKDYKNILCLSEAILQIKTRKEFKKTHNGFNTETPFYFDDLSYTKVFENLNSIPDENLEEALKIMIDSFSKIIKLGDVSEKKETFPIRDAYYLFDIDFFYLELNQEKHLSSRDDVRELMAMIIVIIQKLVKIKEDNILSIKKLYSKYISKLPKSRTAWRLNLYFLSLSPESFKNELKKVFFRIFDNNINSYIDIISGTEYEKSLKIGFKFLNEADRINYVNRIIEFFKDKQKKYPDQNWHIKYGSNILSMIINDLDDVEINKIKVAGFKINSNYEPQPSIVSGMAGTIVPQSPIETTDFNSLKISNISEKMKDEWSPIKLREKYKNNDDFLRPHNAEGIGDIMKNDINKRLQDYIDNSELFFDRDLINPHYTYSFFRGIEDAIKNKKIISKVNWSNFLNLCLNVKNSGEKNIFTEGEKDINSFDGWLAGWTAVHSAMADVIKILVEEENYKPLINFVKHRNTLFNIISYLLEYKNPIPKDEEKDTASMTSGSYNQQKVSDPFSMAINTVRGKAFQAFMSFIFPDGRDPNNSKIVNIKSDTKKLYEDVLEKEETKALMFMYGHYLPSFYFRDIKWVQGLLPKIFSKEENKKYLFLSAFEGFLTNNVYNEMFYDSNFQELYKYALTLDMKDEIRNYFRNPKEGLSTHIAIAFINYKDFDFNHPLFKAFWVKNDPELHSYFVNFIGRNVVHGDNKMDESIERLPLSKNRIREFWVWILDNYSDPKPFTEFGLWINTKKKIFELTETANYLKRTLEKTSGIIEWDYELSKSALELTKASPEEMVSVVKLFFLDGKVRNPNKKDFPIRIDQEWIESFKFLYHNKNTKIATRSLINDLVKEGGSPFWILNDIIN